MKKQKNYLGSNLKFLRERKKKTQTELAESLEVTRAKINAFENGVNSNPTVEDLGKFTEYFKISVDSILWVNLKRLTELQLRNLEAGNDEYVMGTKIRVLATTVDQRNRDNIEIVPIKAKAGYAVGYGNPEFIESLQTFQFPVLSNERKYRMFQIEGDSMLPLTDKSFVIGEFISDWNEIKLSQDYIILTRYDGLVYKQIINFNKNSKTAKVHSTNPYFNDYEIDFSNILEIWKARYYLSSKPPESPVNINNINTLIERMKEELGISLNAC